MGGKYEKGLFNQLQDVMQAFEKLTDEFNQFKVDRQIEIAAMKEAHRQEIAALKAAHTKEKEELNQKIAKLEAKIASLEAENALLKARINKDSGNSGKPPSSNGFKKPQNSREKSERRPGGQLGHKGHPPKLYENPDEVIDLNINIGDTAKAVIALLMNEGAVSANRTQQILRELTEGRLNLSEGSIFR